LPEPPKFQLLTVAQLAQERHEGTLLLDTRAAEQFASLHIPGSIQISLMGHFSAWAAILMAPTQKLLLVAEDAKQAREAYSRLIRVVVERVIGYSLADETQSRKENIELASLSVERCEKVRRALQYDPSLQLVDVRSRAEWLKGHLPGAISLPLLDLDAKAQCIDPSRPSLVYCHERYRATTAASILQRESYGNIGILIDGIEGWLALSLPLEVPNAN
jgi:rhodanese-related sulfurtransferase